MKIVVAGAGAGKTSSMAQMVLDRLSDVKDGKIIYVITYTNAAKNRIKEKIVELNGSIPKQLYVETSHVFLLRNFIFPFHHLLYEQQYTKASQIKLSDKTIYKAMKIKELASNKIVHVEKVTEIAKWVICKKSNDKKATRERREKILAIVLRYLDSVFIDEAQDMDKYLVEIITVLSNKGIKICLVGDPKQDLRGRDAFKGMIISYNERVEYKVENHRCPISHVNLANTFISKEEEQTPQINEIGMLNYVFEKSIAIDNFLGDGKWDYKFILKKNERFVTHANDISIAEQNLSYELKSIVKKSSVREAEIEKVVYTFKNIFLNDLEKLNNFSLFSRLKKELAIELSRQDMGKLGEALDWIRNAPIIDGILVNSIDSVKGLEGNRCLFILTTDLATYLFSENSNQNKMLNYLYVALTRSKKELMILVTSEVEAKYGYEFIETKFNELKVERFLGTD